MWRVGEFIQDEARANYYEDRALMDMAMGNYGQAAIDGAMSGISRMEAVSDLTSPFGFGHHHNGLLEDALIAGEISMIERERMCQMEMAAGRAFSMPPVGVPPYYPPPAPGYAIAPAGGAGVYPGAYPQQYPRPPPPPAYPGYPAGAPGYYRPY